MCCYFCVSILLILCMTLCDCKVYNTKNVTRSFPEGFKFGVATASYQVEGAWNEDGKSENIWDHETHKDPSPILDQSTGDIADDSYHQYKRDVEMMRELGLDYYRFSISWTRIMPTSFSDKINEAGVAYYNNLINEMLKYNIEPMVTLYHWDLPQKLQELGGWTNPQIIDWFADYARVVFTLFGDKVKIWITFNEPLIFCYFGYGSDKMAPRLNFTGIAEYMCSKNLLIAHAQAYHIYNEEFRPTRGGIIGITLSAQWYEPDSDERTVAAEDANQFDWGIYANPIFSESGDYPAVVKERIAARSAEQGYPRSRLIQFTPQEIDYVRGTADFFGLNHYSSYLVYRNESVNGKYPIPSYEDDAGLIRYQKDEWIIGESNMVRYAPWGFLKLLKQIKKYYNNPPIYITENGYSSHGGLQDDDRILYYRGYLDAVLDALEEGSDIRGYTAWSLMDNFEWLRGYTERFGLYEVDYNCSERTRTPRKSAFVYKEIIRTRTLDWNYEPDTNVMTIDENILFTFCLSSYDCKTYIYKPRYDRRSFPEGFVFGAATASYQIEGAWAEDGKSENIWDHETHKQPSEITDQSTGDIADDSYHQYKRDVEIMRELGLDYYRFSISWTRIMPTSFSDKINEAGVTYYNNLINEMLKYNIEPMVTLYHWDLPQKLQELGGWTNPNIIDWYADYARVIFELYGDRVKKWITFNEPHIQCYYGYGSDYMAPKLNITGVAEYMCTKYLLLSHAKVYHMYNEKFRPTQRGIIGITLSAQWYEPESAEHIDAAEEANQFDWGIYAHPIYSDTGDYPAILKNKVAAKSAAQGFHSSRLNEFTPEEVDYVRGTADFFGLNHYTSYLVYRNESFNGKYAIPSYMDDLGALMYQPNEWKIGDSNRIMYAPWGFYNLLTKIRNSYNNPPIYITENGFATHGGLQDDDRITYYRSYLDAMLNAIDEGSDIRGYTAWSLMDNFEWTVGYTERFGLYEVDYSSTRRTRTPRKSAFVYKDILRTRRLDWHHEPADNNMTIDVGH
ncbi:lactase/phlorizin hydrolase-like [Galleria mellonella]|uniref:beta-glucosidase n=1 Tax=Galleria mellonella TaxID=7137 RepID=A0ABM3N4M4_GALME|nr:lactase/phlorizin hydrolase-like [Galleria mellonella]